MIAEAWEWGSNENPVVTVPSFPVKRHLRASLDVSL